MAHLKLVGIGQIEPLLGHPNVATVRFLLSHEPDAYDVAASENTKVPLIEGLADVEVSVSVGNLGANADALSSALGGINNQANHARQEASATREALAREAAALDFN